MKWAAKRTGIGALIVTVAGAVMGIEARRLGGIVAQISVVLFILLWTYAAASKQRS